MEGKAIFTDVSSCAVAVPSPIMATCQPFERNRPADALEGSDSVGMHVITPVQK